jgi:parvulin-like peptidyl-prolyl isomerase
MLALPVSMKLVFATALFLALVQITIADPSSAIGSGDPVIARAKDVEIKQSDMDKVFASARLDGGEDSSRYREARVQVLEQLVDIQLMMQKATLADKAAGQKEGDATFAKALQTAGSAQAMEGKLKLTGMTADELHTKFIAEVTAQTALARELGIKVTDADVEEYYDNNPELSKQPEMVRLRRILLFTTVGTSSHPLPSDTVESKRQQIDELLKRVRAGEDFAALAEQYSEDPRSKLNGGELPPVARDRLDPALANAAFALAPKAMSGVIMNNEGFNIIQLLEKTPAKTVPLSNVAEPIRNFLITLRKRELAPAYLTKLKKDAGLEILDEELRAATAEAAAEAARAAMSPPHR